MHELDRILIETHYLPSAEYFALLYQANKVYLEQEEHYVKRSYRNRTYIAGANGRLRLSVPLQQGKHEQQPIDEVEIAYEDESWYSNHWNSIRSAYGKSPFFIYYADEVHRLLYEQYHYLWELNKAFIDFFIDQFNISDILEYTESYRHQSEHLTDLREALHPRNKDRVSIRLPDYQQVFRDRHGFMNRVSALDLLFCTGPEAGFYLNHADIEIVDDSGVH